MLKDSNRLLASIITSLFVYIKINARRFHNMDQLSLSSDGYNIIKHEICQYSLIAKTKTVRTT